jgi:lipopolysaccharide heptosyltransferase II
MKTLKFNRTQAYLNSFFWLFLTYLLAPYFYFLIFLRKFHYSHSEERNEKLKILVIQIAKIGDLVCTTPIFREIKKKFPSCHLSALIISKTKDILKNNPHLNEVILITDYPGIIEKIRLIKKLRKERYNWVINLSPTSSFNNIVSFWSLVPNRITSTYKYIGEISKLLSIFNNYRLEYKRHTSVMRHRLNLLKFLGIEKCSERKEIFIQPEEEKRALNFLKAQNLSNDDLLIGISVVPGNKLKQWDLAKFASLADQLVEKLKAKIIFIGSVGDQLVVEKVQKMMQNSSINTSGLFKLFELPAFLKKLKLFISVDSGPLYIADAVGTPVIDIVGPFDIREQSPSGNKCKIIQKNIYCVPCSFVITTPRFCKEGHLRCLKEVTPEEVFDAAVTLINVT